MSRLPDARSPYSRVYNAHNGYHPYWDEMGRPGVPVTCISRIRMLPNKPKILLGVLPAFGRLRRCRTSRLWQGGQRQESIIHHEDSRSVMHNGPGKYPVHDVS